MDNQQLFDILEKLLDELEFFASESDHEYKQESLDYCLEVRQKVFNEDSTLSFDTVPKLNKDKK